MMLGNTLIKSSLIANIAAIVIGLWALINAPFIDRQIVAQDGKYFFADMPSVQIISIGDITLGSHDLTDDQDSIENKNDYFHYIKTQYYLSTYITKEKNIVFTLLNNGVEEKIELKTQDYPIFRLIEELPLFIAAICCLFIALLLSRKKQNDLRITIFVMLLYCSSLIFCTFAFWSLRSISFDIFSAIFIFTMNYLAFCFFPVFFLHFFLLFPRQMSFATKKWFILMLYSLPIIVMSVHLSRVFYESQQLLYLFGIVGGIIAAIYAYFHASAIEKAQLKWILWGTAIFTMIMLLTYVLPTLGIFSSHYSYQAPAIAFTLLPITITLAVSKYRLMEIDTLVDNTILYIITLGLLAAIDFAIIYTINTLTPTTQNNSIALLLSLWLAVTFYSPIRSLIEKILKKLLKRNDFNAEEVALELGKAIMPLDKIQSVLAYGIDSLQKTLHPLRIVAETSGAYEKITAQERFEFTNEEAIKELTAPRYLYQHFFGVALPKGFESGVIAPIFKGSEYIGYLLLADKQNQQLYTKKEMNLIELATSQIAIAIESIKIKEIAIADKEKIIQEIHDGIGGITTNIGLISEISKTQTSIEAIRKNINTISELSKDAIFEVRSILQSIDISNTSYNELSTTLLRYGTTMLEPHNISFELNEQIDTDIDSPSAVVTLNILRIFREALANIIKHSGATHVKTSLIATHKKLHLAIEDNGNGLLPEKLGRGIANMHKRAAQINATLKIDRQNGTKINLIINKNNTRQEL